MVTKFFQWGNVAGGGGDTPIIPAEASYGPGEEFSGTLGVGVITVNFARTTKSVKVINQDDTDTFDVSFDGGANWIALGAYGQYQDNISVQSILLRSLVANVDYYVSAILTE